MNVMLFVGPLIDPAEENPHEIDRLEDILDDLNEQLAAQGLPPYEEPDPPATVERWSAMFSSQWMTNLHAFLENFRLDGPEDGIRLRHFIDPAEAGVHYFPVDFPEPLSSQADPEMIYGSCQALAQEIEAVATLLGVPLERFPMDFTGEGQAAGGAWAEIYEEIRLAGANCTKLHWAQDDLESVLERIHEFCETSGVDEDEFKASLIEEHGSLEAYVESLSEEAPSDEENNMGLVFTLVGHYHGCMYAIQNGLTLGIG